MLPSLSMSLAEKEVCWGECALLKAVLKRTRKNEQKMKPNKGEKKAIHLSLF